MPPIDAPLSAIFQPRHRLWLCLIIGLLSACGQAEMPVRPDVTAMPVAPEFDTYYEEFGGDRIFGRPITRPLIDEATGRVTQYFQRMRLDFQPELAPAEQVQPFPLGRWAYTGYDETELIRIEPAVRRQTIAGFEVADPFLTLYEQYDGATLFGPPLSPRIWQGNVRTQYFANGRLEWRPGFPEGERVQVGLLGQAHWQAATPGDYETAFTGRFPAASEAIELIVSVEYPVLYEGDQQLLHVTAMGDEPEANLAIEVQLSPNSEPISLGRTDRQGTLHAEVPAGSWPAGTWVTLLVTARNDAGELLSERQLRFKRW